MVSKRSLSKLNSGDVLISEINRIFKGRARETALDLADQLRHYNEMYGESLTLEEYIAAYFPKVPVEAKKNPYY